jgi:hypothetical protein
MNDLSPPLVPDLTDEWIAARRDRLVREIATPSDAHVSRRLVLSGAGALAGVSACTVVVLAVFAGASAPKAFAGWTATPTQPSGGETARALTQCTAQLGGTGGEASGLPTSGWQPLLTDTRGPLTALVLQSGGATATCITGPSFTSTAATPESGGAFNTKHVLGVATPGSHPVSSVSALPPGGAGPISQATQQQLTASGQPYTFVQGQVAAAVTGLSLTLSDGSAVQATVADGSFVAWWPGSATASSADVTTATGATTQQLTFNQLRPPTLEAGRSGPESP